jgi:excisionase family DNA binding protein
VAELLGVHMNTVLRRVDEGRIKATRLPSGHRRVKTAEVVRLLSLGK